MNVLTVDFGGTTIKAARVESARVVARGQIEGRSQEGLAQALPRLVELLQTLGSSDAEGLAIGLPTLVDGRTNRVLGQIKRKYEGLIEHPWEAWSQDELGLPIRLENDAHAALLGEWRFGAATGVSDLVMITLGTGIGTSVLIDGKALRGRHAHAGNLGGHFVIDPNGFECVCGARGCLEAQQNLSAIRHLIERDPRLACSVLSRADPIDYATLFAHADSDELCRALVDRSLDLWGGLVVSLIHQFDCQRVVVGGRIMRSAAVILPRLQAWADRACTPWGRVHVVAAALGDDAALLGLASLFSYPLEYL